MIGAVLKSLRHRKVRDVLWQALATVGLVVVVVFFVRNASDNMVKAGIASGFQFLWRDSGIEVPFNITGSVQRATKTPATIPSEIRKGENPAVTSLVGASAAPNHAPAAKPHATPRPCREALDNLVFTASAGCAAISSR